MGGPFHKVSLYCRDINFQHGTYSTTIRNVSDVLYLSVLPLTVSLAEINNASHVDAIITPPYSEYVTSNFLRHA